MSKKKPKNYLTIYIHPDSKRSKDMTEDALDEIDCNFSRWLCTILGSLFKICKIISALKKNYRHMKWEILVKDRASGEWYCSNDRIQVREIKR